MGQVIGVFAPIFVIALLGYGCGRLRLLGPAGPTVLSRFVFFVAMPPLIFITLAKRQPAEVAHWDYLAAYFAAIVIGGVAFFALARFVFRETGAKLALGIFTVVNGNAGYLGIPICLYAFGSPLPAILATVIHMIFVYPVLLTWTEIDLARAAGAPAASRAAKIGQVFLVVAKNPLMMATFLGVAAVASGLVLPGWVERACNLLGRGAIPVAVFALGLTLAEKDVDAGGVDVREIAAASVIKLVLIPLLAFVLGRFVFGLSGESLAALVFVAALPSPKNAFILAQRYGVYVRRAAVTVFVTTLTSAVTLPLILYAFGGVTSPGP
ncbi:AEC family transporter [Oleispirillum naphthae]|uniref:AEC family transporter n=1 Tax=Oleispirillum naphthae TaxID=2838853 RepID=UPI0030824DB1